MQLVFSDEFNTDGRSFYPGDDPYWEAVDLHYWVWLTSDHCCYRFSPRKLQQQTNNLEWYDPSAVTTANGSLVITLSEQQTHNLNYQGGMFSVVCRRNDCSYDNCLIRNGNDLVRLFFWNALNL
jgi:beta-glucan synthesis-associated protein KRE6